MGKNISLTKYVYVNNPSYAAYCNNDYGLTKDIAFHHHK
jgi:hypothetical protein